MADKVINPPRVQGKEAEELTKAAEFALSNPSADEWFDKSLAYAEELAPHFRSQQEHAE